jgi:hypothetical protein
MKRRSNFTVLALLTLTAAFAPCFSQTAIKDRRGAALFEGRAFLTDSTVYNSYDLAGSPLGLFDKGSPRFAVEAGYRYTGLGEGAGHYLGGQSITMGSPGIAFARVSYGPDIFSYGDKDAGAVADMTLHRFGLAVASQATSGTIRVSLLADGYYGRQSWGGGDSSRAVMGADRLRLDLGAQVHPMARVGFFVGVSGGIDTLYAAGDTTRRDFSAQMNLPEFGANIDFGGDEAPVRSNLSFSYAFSRFAYCTKGAGVDVKYLNSVAYGDADAISNDSFNIFWAARGSFPLKDGDFLLKPGLMLGYTGNSAEMYKRPNVEMEGFNYLIKPGDAREGADYSLGSFWFGIGAGFKALKYADAHAEYALAAVSLDCGSRDTVGKSVERSATLHHVSLGVSSRLNDFVEMPLELFPRLACFMSGTVSALDAPRLSLGRLNPVPGWSKRALYEPENFLSGFRRVSGFTLGVDVAALEGVLEASVWTTFLSSSLKDEESGLEFGFRAGFLLR